MKPLCINCGSKNSHLHGTFLRKSDSKSIQRYRCGQCYRTFSQATFADAYRQHKRRLNPLILKLYASGISQRRMALIFQTRLSTIQRKLIFLSKLSQVKHLQLLQSLDPKELSSLQMDELLTSHHTKLKPLSVPTIVTKNQRKIIGFSVAQIPAFGPLAAISRRKYGKRYSELPQKMDYLLHQLAPFLPSYGVIQTDEHALYPRFIKKHLNQWEHETYKAQRASVAGQGELKTKDFDPLFSINHTLAMMRANINRLFRRTWNTTKKVERLSDHIWIYVGFHNGYLT
jgi:transposase-like protein